MPSTFIQVETFSNVFSKPETISVVERIMLIYSGESILVALEILSNFIINFVKIERVYSSL